MSTLQTQRKRLKPMRFLAKYGRLILGGSIIGLIIFGSIFAPFLTPYDPEIYDLVTKVPAVTKHSLNKQLRDTEFEENCGNYDWYKSVRADKYYAATTNDLENNNTIFNLVKLEVFLGKYKQTLHYHLDKRTNIPLEDLVAIEILINETLSPVREPLRD